MVPKSMVESRQLYEVRPSLLAAVSEIAVFSAVELHLPANLDITAQHAFVHHLGQRSCEAVLGEQGGGSGIDALDEGELELALDGHLQRLIGHGHGDVFVLFQGTFYHPGKQ